MGVATIIIIIAITAILYFFCCYGKQKSISEKNIQEDGRSSIGFTTGSDFQHNTATSGNSNYLTATMTRGRSIHIGPT